MDPKHEQLFTVDKTTTQALLSGKPILLSEGEVARLIGFSMKTLQTWRMKGTGPQFVRISPRAIRYRLQDIMAWIDENIRTSTSEEA